MKCAFLTLFIFMLISSNSLIHTVATDPEHIVLPSLGAGAALSGIIGMAFYCNNRPATALAIFMGSMGVNLIASLWLSKHINAKNWHPTMFDYLIFGGGELTLGLLFTSFVALFIKKYRQPIYVPLINTTEFVAGKQL